MHADPGLTVVGNREHDAGHAVFVHNTGSCGNGRGLIVGDGHHRVNCHALGLGVVSAGNIGTLVGFLLRLAILLDLFFQAVVALLKDELLVIIIPIGEGQAITGEHQNAIFVIEVHGRLVHVPRRVFDITKEIERSLTVIA